MGAIYYHGKGKVLVDKEKAIQLYQLSADQGKGKALVNLGCHYRDLGNDNMAINYFEKAVLLNYSHAKSHLAFMLETRHPIDENRSRLLYISAAQQGEEYAINRCKRSN